MSTTTIRLTEQLKRQVAQAAKRKGTSPHAFMLDAIADSVDEDERRRDFIDTAEARYQHIIDSGMTVPWSEMRNHLKSQAAGSATSAPTPRKLTAE